MSRQSKWEYLRKIHHRYARASGRSKQAILNEFCLNCGYHRKYAIRLLNGPPPRPSPPPRRKRRPTYGPHVISVLSAIWEAAGYPWSVRLKALLPVWMPWARKRFHLTPRFEQQLLRLSPRTIDYRLRPKKRQLKKRIYGRTKTRNPAEAPYSRQDRWLGRSATGLHRSRSGLACRQLCLRRLLSFAQPDGPPHDLGGD